MMGACLARLHGATTYHAWMPSTLEHNTCAPRRQQFSTRVDVLSQEFIKELEKLQVGRQIGVAGGGCWVVWVWVVGWLWLG